MTQCEQILIHLTNSGGITSAEAMSEYGIMRLASRITDLRRQGVPIRREMVTAKNRNGDPVTFAKYFIDYTKLREQMTGGRP